MSKGKSTQTTEVTIPEYQQQQQQELYSAAKDLAGQPFVPYTGAMVAGFNPDQLRQFEATRSLFETGMQYDPLTGLQELAQAPTPTIQPLTGFQAPTIAGTQAPTAATIQPISTFGGARVQPIRGPRAAQIGRVGLPSAAQIIDVGGPQAATIGQIAGPQAAQIGGVQGPQFRGLLDVDIGAYQSPYQQQVIDLALQDIQRQSDIAQQQAQSQAIRAGAFGGSRSALLEAEATRPYAEQAARTAAQLRQSGFQQAQQAAQADLARQQQLGIFGAEQAQQRALQQAQLAQQAGLTGFEAQQQRAMQQAQLQQQAGLTGFEAAQQRALQQAQLQQQVGLLGAEQAQQRALQQAQLAQQAGLAGYEGALQRAQQQATLAQQAGLAGQDVAAQRALQQASLQQQAGLLGAEQAQQRAIRQAELAQQAGLAGQDIQARMAMFAPQFQLQAQAQRAGLLGALGGEQMQRLGLLGQIGAQQQQLQQAALQFPYQEFQRALAYGPQQLGLLQAGLGTPLTTQTTTGQQKTGTGDILGTAAQLAGMYFLSDKRMKKNIKFLGKEKGHNIYSWNWNDKAKSIGWDKYPTIGVMAQEVMKYMPEAVTKNDDGYYMVNYGVL